MLRGQGLRGRGGSAWGLNFVVGFVLSRRFDKRIVRKSAEELKDGTELSILFIKRHFAVCSVVQAVQKPGMFPFEARPITHSSGPVWG